MSEFLKQLAGAKVFSNVGNRFQAGKGLLIVNDLKIFKGNKPGSDPFTEAAEFVVKKSQPTVEGVAPNAVGSRVSTVFQLSQGKNVGSQQSSAQKLHFAVLGANPDSMTEAQKIEALTTLLRPFPEGNVLAGRTDPSKPCPAKGYMVAYETYKGNDGNYYPNFYAAETTPNELGENLAILAGKDASETK